MKKEEAIDDLRYLLDFDDYGSVHSESILLAIKALEQEPCEDAVSRQSVDELCFRFLRTNSDDNIAFYEHFQDLPSVTPARKQEPILDKIRAEIADLDDADYDYEGYYKAVTDALKIIDKYKAESEE